ncbi:uncharacterized protein LAESUDRAFT_763460 [Laetiporus sulphureus 93-53]|uniref:Uncharacterized protein n=1 Tax=Laetiporus sulphureus 93-53 TaxID=1314785 RepID=A0A165BVD3_9APHY|nr:uncharacterized protein LAESUDRAFT_763460 [Laetiporus sulphureus 93-53]KZT01723.1 hypothetical protein LAESUDRAFT_763460 [Laetiporus sulphureus 93-53]
MAEILQDAIKREPEVVAATPRVQSRLASVMSMASSVVTTKSSKSNTLHEYYIAIHALPKCVQVVFLSFGKRWPHTRAPANTNSHVETERILSEVRGLAISNALLVEIYTQEHARLVVEVTHIDERLQFLKTFLAANGQAA